MTPTEWDRMSWHARARFNEKHKQALRASPLPATRGLDLEELRAYVEQFRRDPIRVANHRKARPLNLDAQGVVDLARRLHAGLPAEPERVTAARRASLDVRISR